MSGNPFDIENHGDAWWVFADLEGGDTELVVPKAFREDNADPASGDEFNERWQVIVLGVAYSVGAATAGDGFLLTAVDASGTRNIYKVKAPAVGATGPTTHDASINTYVKLSPAGAASPAANGAQLKLDVTGTPTGSVLVWGIHAVARGRRENTGSPIAYT